MKVLQEAAGSGVELWPAVKANGYGHGAEEISRELVALGYRSVCVAHLGEALSLVKAVEGLQRVVVLAGMLPIELAELAALQSPVIEPVISSSAALSALSEAASRVQGLVISVHLQVDTGMTRQGASLQDFPALLELALGLPGIHVASTMSHFACADADDPAVSLLQIERFLKVPYHGKRHICNSAGTFRFPQAHFDVCRPGISVYGLHPGSGVTDDLSKSLRPVLELVSRVTLVKPNVPVGTGVSYGHSFVTVRPLTTLAVIPCGYGDGYSRAHGNRAHVVVNGIRCPIVGRVTMDQLIADVTDAGEVTQGQEVTLIGSGITADELAEQNNTINYEITTSLTSRPRRIIVE